MSSNEARVVFWFGVVLFSIAGLLLASVIGYKFGEAIIGAATWVMVVGAALIWASRNAGGGQGRGRA